MIEDKLIVETALLKVDRMSGKGDNAVARFVRRARQRKRNPRIGEEAWKSIVPTPGPSARGVGDWTVRACRNDPRIIRNP